MDKKDKDFKAMVNQGIIDMIKRYLTVIPIDLGVKKAYLFGSFAKGREKEGSDIDVALVVDSMPDFFATQRLLRKLRRKIDLRIEPHPIKEQDFNSLNPFAYEIERTGIKINVGD